MRSSAYVFVPMPLMGRVAGDRRTPRAARLVASELRVILVEERSRKFVGRLGEDVKAMTVAEAGWRGKRSSSTPSLR